MPKYMYKSKQGDVRCGRAASIAALEAKHWVEPGTAKEIPELFGPGDTVDYAAGTFTKNRPNPAKSPAEIKIEKLEARLAKLEKAP